MISMDTNNHSTWQTTDSREEAEMMRARHVDHHLMLHQMEAFRASHMIIVDKAVASMEELCLVQQDRVKTSEDQEGRMREDLRCNQDLRVVIASAGMKMDHRSSIKLRDDRVADRISLFRRFGEVVMIDE